MHLLLATGNSHKTQEFRALLGSDFDVSDLSAMEGIEMPEETGRTFAENATAKALAVSNQSPGIVIADDSGLEVDALDGAPGIYSARYSGEQASDLDNIAKLLRELRAQNLADEKRTGRFRCVIAFARNENVLGICEGVVDGIIVDPPRGSAGFGYDPVFQPNGFPQTFAEMGANLKNEISHRAKAVAALRQALRKIKN